jgi:uncharacterized protein YecE (DUF72 family)
MATPYIGCSGFSYRHWSAGVFYPAGLSQRKWLEHYSTRFNTVELNSTFYRLPPESNFASWRTRTPENFRFAVKGSRLITHIRRLEGCGELVEEFMGRVSVLGDKLGVVLWQLPPGFQADGDQLRQFARMLKNAGFPRHAFEFRHSSWLEPETEVILVDFGFARVAADSRSCPVEEAGGGGNFVYFRRHGPGGRYNALYPEVALQEDAGRIKAWLTAGRDVFVYFNNDARGYAPHNATQLLQMIER